MTAEIIDGKAIAESLRNRLAGKIAGWQVKPYLAVILVGSDPASIIYDRNKQKAAQALGMACDIYHLPEETAEADLLELIGRFFGLFRIVSLGAGILYNLSLIHI